MEHTIILNSGQKVEVLLQDEVSLDIDCSLRYIKSGQKEIDTYVEDVSKPQLDNMIVKAKAEMEDKIASGITNAASSAEAAAQATINNSITAAETQISAYVDANIIPACNNIKSQTLTIKTEAASEAASADASAQAASASAQAASASAQTALTAATAANASAVSAAAAAVQTGAGFDLFDVKFSDHQLDDLRWLRADTFSWQSGAVYEAAYNKLLSEYNATGATATENSVTFKRTASGLKIALADQEDAIATLYTQTGVAWYYILDIENTRFKLPRTRYGFTGLRDNAGDYVAESLPNIKGTMKAGLQYPLDTTGAFYINDMTGQKAPNADNGYGGLSFDASRFSSVYQDGAPVQPRATQMYLYFYVGNYTQSAVEQSAGLNAELFNDKVDADLSNATPSQLFKEMSVGWGLPDYSAGVDVTSEFTVNTWWTATKTGCYVIATGADSYFDIRTSNSSGTSVAGSGPTPYILASSSFMAEAGQQLWVSRKSGAYAKAIYYPLKGVNEDA